MLAIQACPTPSLEKSPVYPPACDRGARTCDGKKSDSCNALHVGFSPRGECLALMRGDRVTFVEAHGEP